MTHWVRILAVIMAMAISSARAESLYDENTYRALASDHKAFQAGDVITVQVFESSSAASSTDTATNRSNNLDASLRLLGGDQLGASAGVAGDFAGGGATQRANRLLATLTVHVREVLPNGDLEVAGEQVLTINDERQRVAIEGRVRPQDVSSDNVVLSTRLANARVEYVGDGELTGRQRRSWWRTLLDLVGF
jgi:flagellar L-ring protein precursor FlgH